MCDDIITKIKTDLVEKGSCLDSILMKPIPDHDTNFKINHADFNKRGIRLPWASQSGLKFLKYVFPGEVGEDPAFSGGEVKVEKHRRQRRFLPQPSTWVGFYFGSILILMLRYDWINNL